MRFNNSVLNYKEDELYKRAETCQFIPKATIRDLDLPIDIENLSAFNDYVNQFARPVKGEKCWCCKRRIQVAYNIKTKEAYCLYCGTGVVKHHTIIGTRGRFVVEKVLQYHPSNYKPRKRQRDTKLARLVKEVEFS